MKSIEFDCGGLGPLQVMGDKPHLGHDFVVHSNAITSSFDYLIFLDSRGISKQYYRSLAHMLIRKVCQSRKTYLLVCRPLELTTWATLYNFLHMNRLDPRKIITNMGFVDFTPKKKSLLESAQQQVEFFLGRGVAETRYLEHYHSVSGVEIPLYALSYSSTYKRAVEEIATKSHLVVMNSPNTSSCQKIARPRPATFYHAINESNSFNQSIRGAVVINFPDFNETLSYDAVHYTDLGNEIVYNKVKQYT